MTSEDLQRAARRLHDHLHEEHWRGDGLVGPDFGVRMNYRVGRFVKSYLHPLPWRDDLYYLQAQAYWVLANWELLAATGDPRAEDLAVACARGMVARQRPDGAWDYPNPEWRGRVANAEGSWAAIALAEAYRRTGERGLLDAALRWHRYLEDEIGYQTTSGGAAANYFAGSGGSAVPNNTAFVVRLLAELANVTGDDRFLARAPSLIGFLSHVQEPSGELPYQLDADGTVVRLHFQCAQYNAFQCLDLLRYQQLTGDRDVDVVIHGLLRFLTRAVGADGSIDYACDAHTPRVTYHAAAVAAALSEGARITGQGSAGAPAGTAGSVLALQRPDGGFPHSRRDYGVLNDRRSYPRPLAMLLHHLLILARVPSGDPTVLSGRSR